MAICGKECEVYSRIVGYHRPLKNWHAGKKAEFEDRKLFKVTTLRELKNLEKK